MSLATSDERPSAPRRSSSSLRRQKPEHLRRDEEPGKQASLSSSSADNSVDDRQPNTEPDADETSSLMSAPGDVDPEDTALKDANRHLHHIDISGTAILKHVEFYQLFILLGSLTGVGLMTIK